ncbi:MAG: NUDIX hydrolase [Candidatus Binataceae bacterium]|nr:NUDIX hydrolase [Candidatus Binataceae bacterium]
MADEVEADVKVGKWETVTDDQLVTTPIFDLSRRRSRHTARGTKDFYILEAPAWVNIIPLTAGHQIVFVRQWRHGISGFTLEIPGGMVDPEDRSPKSAARREMREESGYDAKRIVALGRVHPNPAFQPNWCYTYLALDAHQVGEPIPNADEETEVVMVPAAQVSGLIASGKITHALVIAGFALFDLYRRKNRAR